MKKVIVGIPIRNEESFLRQSLESLLKNYDFIDEIIISDNNSDDKTPLICNEYTKKYSKIKYYRQDQTLKSIDNFKFILANADSEFFLFYRGKNQISSNFIQDCIEILLKNPESSVVFPFFYKAYQTDYSDKSLYFDPCMYKLNSNLTYDRVRTALRYVLSCLIIYGFFRTNTLKEEFFKLESEEAACDQVLALRMALRSPIMCDNSIYVEHFLRKSESVDVFQERYKKMGFYVENYNIDWHLVYEFHLLCRLKSPQTYSLIKEEIDRSIGLSRKSFLSNEDILLRTTKGRFVELISKKSIGKKIAFMGTSSCAESVHNLLGGRLIPNFYVDNDKQKSGSTFFGKKIYTPEEILDNNTMTCVVNVDDDRFIWEIYDQLTSLGFVYMENLFFLAREVRDNFV